jgi:hypothetical protein
MLGAATNNVDVTVKFADTAVSTAHAVDVA